MKNFIIIQNKSEETVDLKQFAISNTQIEEL